MARAVEVEVVGLPQLRRKLSLLETQIFPQASARALNRVAEQVRTLSARQVAKAMGVKQKDVRDNIKLKRARPDTNATAVVQMRGASLNLIRFKARQAERGVSASPWGRRRVFTHAFIARINGTDVVMVRRKRGGDRVHRLPIRPVRGPGVAKTAAAKDLAEERRQLVMRQLPIRLAHELDFAVKRLPS